MRRRPSTRPRARTRSSSRTPSCWRPPRLHEPKTMPASFEFHSRWVLWLMAAAPVLLAWAYVERRTRAVFRFSAASVLVKQGRGLRPYLLPVLPVLRVLAICCALVALARPQERDARLREQS